MNEKSSLTISGKLYSQNEKPHTCELMGYQSICYIQFDFESRIDIFKFNIETGNSHLVCIPGSLQCLGMYSVRIYLLKYLF